MIRFQNLFRAAGAAISWRLLSAFVAAGGVATAAGVELRYAQNFRIEEMDGYRLLTIRNTWVGSGDTAQRYALVPKASALPKLEAGTVVVRTPVERTVILATVFLGPIQDLKLHDSLVGIGYLDFANDPIAHERVRKALAKEVATGTALEVEPLLMLKPDLVLTSTTGNAIFDTHPALVRAGLPVVVTAGYMEQSPLARTEWIKCIAAFYEKDAEAEAIFDAVASRYESLRTLAAGAANKPTVMSNAPYGGIWHVPGGRSYMAQAIADAGGEYVWSRLDSSGGVPLDMEVILRDAAKADVWLNPSHYRTLSALRGADERFVGFRSLREGNVFNNTVRLNEKGGNDIFERGVSHPEEVLADLIKILHPELLPDHELVFYERLR